MYLNPAGPYTEQILLPLAELQPDELTLGSELDVSAYEFAAEWQGCLERLRPFEIVCGHKLNHDWRSATAVIRNEANRERKTRGLPPQSVWGYRRALDAYLRRLDYVAVSYYPSGELDLPVEYTIGEWGLGSTDITRPWHFDETTFRTPADFKIRRDYYLRFLNWLKEREGRAASLWTAGHFDIAGIMHPEWRDEEVADAIVAYNQASP